MMKKIITIFMAIMMLVGCQEADDADYEGRYALLRKDECTYLVVHWEYPMEGFDLTSFNVDVENISAYIDENAPMNGNGLVLNSLLGNLGYNKSFLHFRPIGISADDINTIIKKKIKIYMSIDHEDGNSYKVRLKYDKTIKE